MGEYIIASLINGIVVALGVFGLWTFTRWVPAKDRGRYAAVVGGTAAVITLIVTSLLAAKV
jgi:hypothetical protein